MFTTAWVALATMVSPIQLPTLSQAPGLSYLAQGQTPAPNPTTYTDTIVNLAFDYPATWTVTKRSRDLTKFTIATPDSKSTAELEVQRAPFHSSKQIWQTIQLRVNEQLKRQVVRQYEQDVLDVPLLLTQVGYTAQDAEKVTLTGLYYTRTAVKLIFRLTAYAEDFDKANFAFQEALQTVRSLDGKAPQEDDESVTLTAPPRKAPPAPPVRRVIEGSRTDTGKAIPMTEVPVTVSTKPVILSVPSGWSAEAGEGGRMTLKHADLKGSLTFELRTTLDSEPAQNALFRLSSASLEKFTAVLKREDSSNEPNRNGCRVTTIWRAGKGDQGKDLFVFEAAGTQEDLYFLLQYTGVDATGSTADRKLIRGMLDLISLKPGT